VAEHRTREFHPAFEEYCEAIFELQEDAVEVIQARIADRLEVSRPAVSEMIRRMEAEGLITVDGAIRLTADGQLRNCLFAVDEFDLRAVVRSGGSDDDLSAVLERAVQAKWAGHAIGQVHFIRPRRSMSQIGG